MPVGRAWWGAGGACALAVALACSGGGSSGGGDVCDSYFNAIYVGTAGCYGSGPAPPSSELDRIRPRWDQLCHNALALPGQGITTSFLQGCGSAVSAAGGCPSSSLTACQAPAGTLAAGTTCNSSTQCQSLQCNGTMGGAACGTCAPAIPVGQQCGNMAGGCVGGAVCDSASTPATCQMLTVGAAGAPCDDQATICGSGLYCDLMMKKCATQLGAGATCHNGGDCMPPLVCSMTQTPTCVMPGASGATCMSSSDCATGLGCSSMNKCTSVTWAQGGQPCDGNVTLCLVGFCNVTAMGAGTCPTVIADGQPCMLADPAQTCDTFAQCVNLTCQLPYAMACK
jgi:hypothetical protein